MLLAAIPGSLAHYIIRLSRWHLALVSQKKKKKKKVFMLQ